MNFPDAWFRGCLQLPAPLRALATATDIPCEEVHDFSIEWLKRKKPADFSAGFFLWWSPAIYSSTMSNTAGTGTEIGSDML